MSSPHAMSLSGRFPGGRTGASGSGARGSRMRSSVVGAVLLTLAGGYGVMSGPDYGGSGRSIGHTVLTTQPSAPRMTPVVFRSVLRDQQLLQRIVGAAP